MKKRTERLNSLLKEVLTEVIRQDVKNPNVSELFSITEVDITKDLHHAKVYISVIGDEKERKATIDALQSAAGFISSDTTVDKQMKIDALLKEIEEEKKSRDQ